MQEKNLKIAVVGAGAIGGIVGAILTREGYDVEIISSGHRNGISEFHVSGVRGDFAAPVRTTPSATELKEKKDIVFLATKAGDCVAAAKDLLPFLHDNSAVVSLQNGICEEMLAEVLGPERTIACVIEWSATRHEENRFEMTAGGEFIIGRLDGKEDERLTLIQKMLTAIVPTRISENMMGELYSKLVINACINSLSVITGATTGKLVRSGKIRRLFIDIIKESMTVADRLGTQVEPRGGGKLDYYTFISGSSVFADIKRHIIVLGIGFKTRKIIPSSLQSIRWGQKTETPFFNGYIIQKGRETGVATPANDFVSAHIEKIEAGTVQPGDSLYS